MKNFIQHSITNAFNLLFESEIEKSKLVDFINEDISRLYTAAIQYNNHAALIKGAEWMGYVTDLVAHSEDDMKQAYMLCEKVAYYGGSPVVNIKAVTIASESIDMIKQDAELQKENIDIYKQRVEFCREQKEFAMESIYKELLRHEEEHHNTTLAFLNK